MQNASDYELASITEFLPSNDPAKKHCVLDSSSKLGFLVPCCPGSYIGPYLWKVSDLMHCLEIANLLYKRPRN